MLPFVLGADALGGGELLDVEIGPAPVPTPGGSWYGLTSIIASARQAAEDDARRPPVACPNDLQALLTGPDGQLYCPWDGWRPR